MEEKDMFFIIQKIEKFSWAKRISIIFSSPGWYETKSVKLIPEDSVSITKGRKYTTIKVPNDMI